MGLVSFTVLVWDHIITFSDEVLSSRVFCVSFAI